MSVIFCYRGTSNIDILVYYLFSDSYNYSPTPCATFFAADNIMLRAYILCKFQNSFVRKPERQPTGVTLRLLQWTEREWRQLGNAAQCPVRDRRI